MPFVGLDVVSSKITASAHSSDRPSHEAPLVTSGS